MLPQNHEPAIAHVRETAVAAASDYDGTEPAVELESVVRSFRGRRALDGVSLHVPHGEIHALLGANGAGKTTVLRVLAGLIAPDAGCSRVLGEETVAGARRLRGRVGVVPSGDRSFYLRISGLENLTFFGRLQGMKKRKAIARAEELLAEVGLSDAARRPVGHYSHGMQKRLSVARALMADPGVLLVDEATHDLDPEGSIRVRELLRSAAIRGAAVLWATQRLEEIPGFAERVTLLKEGRTCFTGTVSELMERSTRPRYLLQLRNGHTSEDLDAVIRRLLDGVGEVRRSRDSQSFGFLLTLSEEVVLGDALAVLVAAGIQILGCREERSDIEGAFLSLAYGTEPR